MKVAVIGGGISGLAAARFLAEQGCQVLLLEQSPRCGGKLAGVSVGELEVDGGAESALARVPAGHSPEVLDLLQALACEVVAPEPQQARILVEGQPVPMPRSMVGVPWRAEDLKDLLSAQGFARAMAEPTITAPPLAHDEAIGVLVDQRFGPEVTDRLLEPMLGGVYAGHSRQLSAQAVVPAVWQRIRGGGPWTTEPPLLTSSGPVLVGTPGGMHTVIGRLIEDLLRRGVQIETNATVRALHRTTAGARGGWQLTVGPAQRSHTLDCDAVIVAVAAAPLARLVADLVPKEVAAEIAEVDYASVAVLTVLATGLSLEGSGLLVPPGEMPTVKAMTHSTQKWGWLRDTVTRQHGADFEVARVSVGRAGNTAALQLGDEALARHTVAEAQQHLAPWRDAVIHDWHLQRWGGGLPQYGIGHQIKVTRWREALSSVPTLAACGALWDGVGIAACLRSARSAVHKVLAQ